MAAIPAAGPDRTLEFAQHLDPELSRKFTIEKRTSPRSGWVRAVSSGRSLGLAYAVDTSGGLAIGMHNFWQLSPTALEIQNAAHDHARMTVCLWSPEVPAIHMRPYDDKFHAGDATYEDWEPG